MLAGEHGSARQWAIRHQVAVGEFFDAPDFVAVGQAHIMADTESLGPVGRAWLEELAALPSGRAARAHPHHHRPARPRLRQLQAPQADAGHGRHRGARHCRLRGARRADDQHLHQLPDHPAAGARRAPGDGRHRRRHLLQQRAGRAQQLRGRAVCAGRRPHRPHAALRLSPRCSTAPAAAISRWPISRAIWPTGARSAASSARPPTATGRCRSSTGLDAVPNSDEMKHFGAALASFGSVALFHIPGVTPEARSIARSLRRPPGAARGSHRAGRFRRLLRQLRGARRQGRRGGVRCAAALADRDGPGGRPARRPACARRHHR